MIYYDKYGVQIKAGDIIASSDITPTHIYKTIDEVKESIKDGILIGITRVQGSLPFKTLDGKVEWTIEADSCPCSIKSYATDRETQILKGVKIIGNVHDNPDMFTIEHAKKHFGYSETE